MNNLTEKLREDREKGSVAYLRFTRRYKQEQSALFCFFEGEDSQYYGVRIELIAKPNKDYYFQCEGKKEVLRTYRLITEKEYYNNAKTAYFIDRDFDQPIHESSLSEDYSKVYETPCYSIENFYTSVNCFKNILRRGFNLAQDDEDFNKCLQLYQKLQVEFHQKIGLLNAYIACLRENQEKLNLGNFKLNTFIKTNLDKIEATYTIDTLNDKFSPENHPSEDRIQEKLIKLSQNCQKSFRGKFEIEFLRKFLEKLKENSQTYCSKKLKAKISVNSANLLSDLSQYAETPDCLKAYLTALAPSRIDNG